MLDTSVEARSLVVGFAAGMACRGLLLWLWRKKPKTAVAESTIRRMTRLAIQHKAVNLSQGFPNEPPPRRMAVYAAAAILCGEEESARAAVPLLEAVEKSEKDALNQYSFPYGAPFLREAIAGYYKRWYNIDVDPATQITVCMGATEGFAATLRGLASPGDPVVFFQPFHELYPSQVAVFHMEPRAVSLVARGDAWTFDKNELDRKLRGAKLFLFNSPHNPTGHVFTPKELAMIGELCAKHNTIIVTDEIYEHVNFNAKHQTLFPQCVLVNSISKTAKATGWRIGWVLADEERTARIRGVHDQLVACCPTPLQFGVASYLGDPENDTGLHHVKDDYIEKRDLLVGALTKAGFDTGPLPGGAYYVFADYSNVPALKGMSPTDAAVHMTSQVKVACVPGDNFYLTQDDKASLGSKYLRFAFVRSIDVLQAAAHNLATKL